MTSIADSFNPFLGPTLTDPDSVLAPARAQEPVFFSPVLQSWIITRYDDVVEVLKDPTTFSSAPAIELYRPEVREVFGDEVLIEGTLIGVDPPAHTRQRRILAGAFTPSRVAGMADRIRETAHHLLDGLPPSGEMDLLADFTLPLPLHVIFQLIGIPYEDFERCQRMAADGAELPMAPFRGIAVEEQVRLAESFRELYRYLRRLIALREDEPQDDLVTALVELRREDESRLSDRELVSLLPGLAFAGHETTASLVAHAVFHLLDTSGWKAVCADPALIEGVVEETLRFESPAFGVPRTVTRDTSVGGVAIPAGSRLYAVLFSAGRDEGHYADGDRFLVERADQAPLLAFGRGIHFCVGASLARLEAKIALEVLTERLPDLRLVGAQPTYRWNFILRGLTELPVAWG